MHLLRVILSTTRRLLCLIVAGLPLFSSCAQTTEPAIRLNQIGFYPNGPKRAIVTGKTSTTYFITTPNLADTVFRGELSDPSALGFSNRPTQVANFSALKTSGTFVVNIPGVGVSHPFEIRTQVHREAAAASLKGFYYLRSSTALPQTFAGIWHRPAGHPDTQVLIHPSAASDKRPAGTVISSPRGWYDAGDYNKYIVNSGITMGTLLSAYEDYPAYFKLFDIKIPESGNAVPDLLEEVLWNLRWMLTMQDPADGGVYHKLTNPKFDGMVMPDQAKAPRYVVQKSTAATLDFAAVMAQASRVYKEYGKTFPGLSDSCLTAAVKAWEWANKNPAILYKQEEMNKAYDPDVSTGTYGDGDVSDEFIWAASELLVATKNDKYYKATLLFPDNRMPLPAWAQVRLLGYYTLLRFEKDPVVANKKEVTELRKRLIQLADDMVNGTSVNPYQTVMGKSEKDYIWGSSSVAANQGIALLQAFRLTGDSKYMEHALGNLDYLLGRNATGYSFLTGHGDKTPMHPHHRTSEADGIPEPVPGLLVGGPNANAARQDKCSYSSTVPDEVYTDDVCSYASNEIAINWNAPFVYLATALEALQNKTKNKQ